MILSHDRVWAAIDALAARNDLSASALAKRAGLDSTAFNKSKRTSSDGRPRWPSTESLAKIIAATKSSMEEFMGMMEAGSANGRSVPLIGFAQAGAGGYFDDAGFPVGHGFDLVELPGADEGSYALQIQGDSMLPVYRSGDVLIVRPDGGARVGDRVVVRTRAGEVMAKVLDRRTSAKIELRSLNPEHPVRTIPSADVEWIARIVWASQ